MQIEKIVKSISTVQGVMAIALGGSQSRGEADKQSDYDIGVYYDADMLDITALAECLKELDDGHKDNLLNPPGQWGPWINGGAWITFNGMPVDILLRDIKRVEVVLQDCIEGKISVDYQSGHPFGFVNLIYAAETHYSKPLWQDESLPLHRLKALLYSKGEYSPQMREAVIRKFLWEAWFSLACGRKAAFKGDINYVMGSVFRAVCSWIEVLYALNHRYLMNEKGALKWIDGFVLKPIDMEVRVMNAYKHFADGDAKRAYQILDELHNEVEGLSNEIQQIPTEIR
ncbi:nucleotidyltransferase domain-containing protein [Anaerocolumna aminovalerica]|uniref:nucleotidyltransferase domain-containing protein n=1 Tax=Anaerocolumna aminovalerica TaxID=1527 RepID=UPI000BE25EBE|nr:nucleotidyltransferase domain-containing protein [Anaerocolumna aminovalerica]MBU5330868.1 nucleotidyltransferase domain-containing protein [Anaerocolumna aminovalerica]